MFITKNSIASLIAAAGFAVTNINTVNAAALRHVPEDRSDSRDAGKEVSISSNNDINRSVPDESTNGTTYEGIISMIKPATLGEVFPNSFSILGCVRAKDNVELQSLIDAADTGGEVRLCPGIVEFNDVIYLTASITITCAGPKYSCIFDGKGVTWHLVSESSSAYAFSGIAFVNGLSYGSGDGYGGSVYFYGPTSTSLFDRCLFYNNGVFSSGAAAVIAPAVSSIRIAVHACFTFAVHIQLTLSLNSSCVYFFQGGGAFAAFGGTTVVNNCVFLGNTATSESDQDVAYGGLFTCLMATLVYSIVHSRKIELFRIIPVRLMIQE